MDVTVVVDDDELDEAREEDELLLCTALRWGMNMRDTSSVLIAEKLPEFEFPPFQPSRDSDWKLGGEATAVVMGYECVRSSWLKGYLPGPSLLWLWR